MKQTQQTLKERVAEAALDYIDRPTILGIGSGTTVFELIRLLPKKRHYLQQVVAASQASCDLLNQCGITAVRSRDIEHIDLYLDGADELDHQLRMIKGGGAALTGEKILANLADRFICLVDQSKLHDRLGSFPLPIEIIPDSLSLVRAQLYKWGASSIEVCVQPTEWGNLLLRAAGLDFTTHDPLFWEERLNGLAGVVTNGVFAQRAADLALAASEEGVSVLYAN